MQIHGLRTSYATAIKKARTLGRPHLHANQPQIPSPSPSVPEAPSTPEVSRHGLSGLMMPSDDALQRQVSHSAGKSYSDEAKLAIKIRELQRALKDIHQLQRLSSQMGPAVYA